MSNAKIQVQAGYISEADFFAHYEGHYEWLDGMVLEMPPLTSRNYEIQKYLSQLLDSYFYYRPIGQIREDPFTMRLKDLKRNRQPDIFVILKTNPHDLKETYLDGAADICVEIVSEASIETDRGTKFAEYQKAGVGEYWIIDPLREEALFYRLDENGVYQPQKIENGRYHTPQLPDFALEVAILWKQGFLPRIADVVEQIKLMLGVE